MTFNKIAIIAAKNNSKAIDIKDYLLHQYQSLNFIDISDDSNIANKEYDLIIAIGGDGLMLHLLHIYEKPNHHIPHFYGINCGTVGFLMNCYNYGDDIMINIAKANNSSLHPLRMNVVDNDDNVFSKIAINEVAIFRASSQAAKIKISVNDQEKIDCLVADGVLVATAAGSTAYNLSVRGPIIPLEANIIALTPISPFRPRNWRGALLSNNSKIIFEIINPLTRIVNVTADFNEIKSVKRVEIYEEKNFGFNVLFDSNHSLEARIIAEQFNY
jgi:NAD+ kinase